MTSSLNYTAILHGDEHAVRVECVAPHQYRVTVDEQTHTVDMRHCSNDALSILWNNRSYDISYDLAEETVELVFWNQRFTIQLLDERSLRMRRVRSELDITGPEIIKTSMPGKIVKVLVEPGMVVEPGSPIIIMEAMKMENEMRCRRHGSVRAVHVTAGQVVDSDELLVEIAPLEDAVDREKENHIGT